MAHRFLLTNLIVVWILIFGKVNCTSEGNDALTEEQNQIDSEIVPLLLTPLIKAGRIKEAQNAAEVTKIQEMETMKSYSGYLTVNEKHKSNMFFWFFPSQNDYENAPLVLWLQGGPGRSSMRGLLMENGPFDIGTGFLKKRNATWTQDHSVIYLDNPVGAGFSNANIEGYHATLTAIGEDLYNAIQQFFQLFPNLQKNEFYIAGQSYAGKYVPTISHLVHKRNPEAKQKINLVGIAIGNGLVDPETQLHYSDFLYQIGLINSAAKKEIELYENVLINQTQNKQWKEAYETYSKIVLNARDSLYRRITRFGNVINMLEPNASNAKEVLMSKYVSQPAIRKAIHAGNQTFWPYSGFIQYLLKADMMQSVAPLISELLNNYKVMIYNGQLDIIIPYRTTVNYIEKLKFNGTETYENAERYPWYVDNTLAGYVTQVGNLTEVMVRNAGHSVPEDQIVWATDMLYRFTRNKPFKTVQIQNNTTAV